MLFEALAELPQLEDPDEKTRATVGIVLVIAAFLVIELLLIRGLLRRGPRSRFLLMVFLSLGVVFAGPGRYSLDHLIRNEVGEEEHNPF